MKTNTMVPQPTIYGRDNHKHQILFDHNSTKMKNEFCMLDNSFTKFRSFTKCVLKNLEKQKIIYWASNEYNNTHSIHIIINLGFQRTQERWG